MSGCDTRNLINIDLGHADESHNKIREIIYTIESKQETVKRILQSNKTFYNALEDLDIRHMKNGWAPVKGIQCTHPGWDTLTGWVDVMDSWIVIFNNTNRAQFRITDAQVKLCGIYAQVTCVENITVVVNGRV